MTPTARLRVLVPFLVVAAALGAQTGLAPQDSPLRLAQEAILRGDRAAAQQELDRLLGAWKDDAELLPRIALLRAAAAPAPQRAAALLGVAEAFADRPEADVALVGALASVEGPHDHEGPLQPPAQSEPQEPQISDRADRFALLPRLRAALFRRETAAGAAPSPALADARARFDRLSGSHRETARVRTGVRIDLPHPLAERARVALIPLSDPFAYDAAPPPPTPPVASVEAGPGDARGSLAPPPPGAYVLEAVSLDGVRRARRRLLVTDLDLAAVGYPDAVVVAATFAGKPQEGVELTLIEDADLAAAAGLAAGGVRTAKTDARGLATIPRRVRKIGEVRARFGDHVADLWLPIAGRERDVFSALVAGTPVPPPPVARPSVAEPVAHVVVDRPLYRPGDAVEGRVILRAARLRDVDAGVGAPESVVDLAPPPPRPVRVVLFPHEDREMSVVATTDADGVATFRFALPTGAPRGRARLVVLTPRLGDEPPGREQLIVADEQLFEIADFVRPPLYVSARAPAAWRHGEPDPEIVVEARRPSGEPAAFFAARCTIECGGFTDAIDVRTDDAGSLRIPCAFGAVGEAAFARTQVGTWGPAVEWRVDFVADDGQTVSQNGVIAVLPAQPAPQRAHGFTVAVDRATPAVAGAPVALLLTGAPNGRALVVGGRTAPFAAAVAAFDAEGRARIELPTPPWAWPHFDVTATAFTDNGGHAWTDRVEVLPRRADGDLVVRLAEDGRACAPGAPTTLTFAVANASGAPVAASLAVAVVDEAVFALAEDRVAVPSASLRPSLPTLRPGCSCSVVSDPPGDAAGALFYDGFVDRAMRIFRAAGGGGAVRPGAERHDGLAPRPRVDLRATAAFAGALKTDARGVAALTFTTPDGLARWRVVAWAVADDGASGVLRGGIRTTKEHRVTIVPPRFQRAGDALDVSLYAAADAERTATVTVEAGGPLRADVGDAPPALRLPPNRATRVGARTIAGEAPGIATLTATLRDGDAVLDAETRTWPVLDRLFRREFARGTLVGGRQPVRVELPDRAAAGPDAGDGALSFEILSGRAAVLRAAAETIENPERGGVEGAAVALAPLVAEAMRRGAAGPDRPALDAESARRAATAFARLRDLRTADGFAWRKGGENDYRLTPFVIHLLAAAKTAGLDPHRADAEPDFRAGFYAVAGRALKAAGGDPESALQSALYRGESDATADNRNAVARFEAAVPPERRAALLLETAAAMLRLTPDHREAKEGLVAFAKSGRAAHATTLVRAGFALQAAGETDLAAALLRRLAEAAFEGDSPLGPESPAAFAADRLRLTAALRADAESRAELATDLLRATAAGAVRTSRTAAAVVLALAEDLRLSDAPPARVATRARFDVNGRVVEVPLVDGRGRFDAPAEAGPVPPTRTSAVDGADFVVVARRAFVVDAARAPAFATGLTVERRVFRLTHPGASEAPQPLAADADGAYDVLAGETIEVETAVAAATSTEYATLMCPTPAGAEALAIGSGAEAYDDRVVFGLESVEPARPATVRVRYRFGGAADVVWPPARADAAFLPDVAGASAGARFRVRPAVESAAASRAAATPVALAPEKRAAALAALVATLRAKPAQASSRVEWTDVRRLAEFPDAGAPAAGALVALEVGGRGALGSVEFETLRRLAGPHADAWLQGSALSQLALGPAATADAADFCVDALDGPYDGEPPVDPQAAALLRAAAFDDASALGAVEREIVLLRTLIAPPAGATFADRLRALDRALDHPGGLLATPARRARRLEAYFRGAEAIRPKAETDGGASGAALLDRLTALFAAERHPTVLAVLFRQASTLADRRGALEEEMTTEIGSGGSTPPVNLARAAERVRDAALDALLAAPDAFATVASDPARVADTIAGPSSSRLRRAARLLAFLGADARYDRSHDDPRTVALRAVLARLRDDVGPADEPAAGLRALLAEPRGLFLEPAYRAFDAAGRAALPAEVLVRALRIEDEPTWVDEIAARPDGRALLRAAAVRGLGVRTADAALRALADEPRPLTDVPLAELLRHRPGLSWRAGDVVDAELASRAAERPQDLAEALAAGGDVRARETLARVLGDAGFVDVPWRADDGLSAALADQLRARTGDAAAAEAVRARIAALDEARSARRPASEDERAALLAALTTTLAPLDVVSFGAPPASTALTTRMAAWTDAALREALTAEPPADAGAEEDRRGSVATLLALLPAGRIDSLRSDVVRWWDAHAGSLGAAERTDVFARAGAAQLDLLPRLMSAPPSRAGETRPAELAAARVRVIEALDRRRAILTAAESAAVAAPDDATRTAYARLRLAATGRSFRVRLTDGREVLVAPTDADAALAAVVARLAAEGWDAVPGFEPDLRAAWSAAVRARGAWLD
jgi:hypothetical protein